MSSTGDSAPEPTPPAAGSDRSPRDEAVGGSDGATEVGAEPRTDTLSIHRSPRYFRFMIAGGIVGLIVALGLTFGFPEPTGFNPLQIFGFLGIVFVVIGVIVGSVIALIVDRAARRRAKTVDVARVSSTDPDGS